jgi:hypothetical protein
MDSIEINEDDIEVLKQGQYVERLSKNKKLKEEFLYLDLLNSQLILNKTKSSSNSKDEKLCKKSSYLLSLIFKLFLPFKHKYLRPIKLYKFN